MRIFTEYFFRNCNDRFPEKRKTYCRYTHLRIARSLLFLTTVWGRGIVVEQPFYVVLCKNGLNFLSILSLWSSVYRYTIVESIPLHSFPCSNPRLIIRYFFLMSSTSLHRSHNFQFRGLLSTNYNPLPSRNTTTVKVSLKKNI